MSLQLRLVLWYGALCALLLMSVIAFSYASYERSLYDDIDRALITVVGHTTQMATVGDVTLKESSGGYPIMLRVYEMDQQDVRLTVASTGANDAPLVDPQTVLSHPGGPAFNALGYLAPPARNITPLQGSAFGVAQNASGRWRVYVAPFHAVYQGHAGLGYIVALTPLVQVDAALTRLSDLLIVICLVGLIAELVGSWLVVRSAFSMVNRMTDTAQSIASSRDFSRRIPIARARDEVARLAQTLNTMLNSLQSAHALQQRFVSDASHELRAPLTAMQANLDLIRRHPEAPAAERDEAFAEVERESGRLTRLVADLLALARADAGVTLKRQSVDLDALLLDAFRTARALAHGQEVTLEPFEPVQVMGDEDRLKQLMLILLDNAFKYTPADGRVTLGVRRLAPDAGHTEAQAEILVSDTGVGVNADDLPHVFERFYRADPARGRDPGGTGLGLPIAQWIVEQHGGSVTLQSAPGQGTIARVRLPLAR